MRIMRLKKWVLIFPVFIAAMVGCNNSVSTATAIPTIQSVSETATPTLPIVTEQVDTPTNPNNWYSHPDSNPDALEKSYGILNSGQVPIYETLEDAVDRGEQYRLAPEPPAYLAYDQTQTMDGIMYVHLTDGGWMSKADLEPVTVTSFSGLIISEVPSHPFGWVVTDTTGWTNSQADESSGMVHSRYEVLSVLEEDRGFARIETGDWLPISDLALVDLRMITTRPSSSCRWVDIDLSAQTLVAFDSCQPVFATLISSAKAPAVTPLGTFSIVYKEEKLPLFANERVASSKGFYLADVPWLMFFHENWAIHGTYWHDRFGEPWSHGCVNVSPYDARWLYEWSKLDDIIVVHE